MSVVSTIVIAGSTKHCVGITFHIFSLKTIWPTDIWSTYTLLSLLLSYLYHSNIVPVNCVRVLGLFIEKHFADRYFNDTMFVVSTIVIVLSTKHCVGIMFHVFSSKTIWSTDIWST